MGGRAGGGGLGSMYSNIPRGGFKNAPFEGAVKVGDLKDGDYIVTPEGLKMKVSIPKKTKTQTVIGTFNGFDVTWAVVKNNYYLKATIGEPENEKPWALRL